MTPGSWRASAPGQSADKSRALESAMVAWAGNTTTSATTPPSGLDARSTQSRPSTSPPARLRERPGSRARATESSATALDAAAARTASAMRSASASRRRSS